MQWPSEKGEQNISNGQQNNTEKTKETATRTPLNTRSDFKCGGRDGSLKI